MPSSSSAAIRTACILFLATAAGPAFAQASEGAGPTRYDADYFTRSQPSSALDMVTLLPGFRLQEGNADLRGYAGAGGNVLVDGQRPASKQDTLETILKRIPARSVERIELIRGGAGFDMQGHALLANVVRTSAASLNGRVETEYARFRHGYDAPRLAGELRYVRGESVLDLSGALYRQIDDEHGFGTRNRYAADGTPIRLAAYAQPEGDNVREVAGSYQHDLAGGTLRVNGLYKMKKMFANISDAVTLPTRFDASGSERVNTEATELGLHYDRPLGAQTRLELLALRRTTGVDGTDRSFSPGGTGVTREQSDATETIVRGVLRHQAGALSLEGGIEGALNTLDSHSALEEDGVNVPLPAGDMRVEEKRAEAFATATWQAMPRLSIEMGARFEASRLTQSGDNALRKSLSFLKPRLLLRWTPSPHDEIRALVEREVGQLDFDNFVGSASLTSGSVTAGNKDLEPDSLWRGALTWEHHIGEGSIVLTAQHERISHVVDRIPVVVNGAAFDAVGNIGNGTREILQANLNMPLDRWGLKGVIVQADGTFTHSRVTDPVTGERRAISKSKPVDARIGITHDLTAWHLRWGANYVFAERETEYKVDEIEIDRVSNRVDLFVEYKPDEKWTLRAFAKNITDSPVVRERTIHTGLRSTAPLKYFERRTLNSGHYVGLTVQRAFGG